MNRADINYWLNESPEAKFEQKQSERLAYYRHLRAQGFAALDAYRYIKHWSK
jgi:hypothetical protein